MVKSKSMKEGEAFLKEFKEVPHRIRQDIKEQRDWYRNANKNIKYVPSFSTVRFGAS